MLILLGMFIGAIAWHIGMLIADDYRKRHGCYGHCVNCGKPVDRPLTEVLKRTHRPNELE